MQVEFCECGGILLPERGGMRCRSCGRTFEKRAEKITTAAKSGEMVVIEDNAPDLPETDKRCPKCANSRAYWWLIQTRSSDEPPTQFFRCTKCRHTWREYK